MALAVVLAGCGSSGAPGPSTGERAPRPRDGERVTYEGRIVNGVECLALRIEDRRKIAIAPVRPPGDRFGFEGTTYRIGQRVRVTGRFFEVSPCGSGVEPTRIVRVGDP